MHSSTKIFLAAVSGAMFFVALFLPGSAFASTMYGCNPTTSAGSPLYSFGASYISSPSFYNAFSICDADFYGQPHWRYYGGNPAPGLWVCSIIGSCSGLPPVNGACGTRNTTYAESVSAWPLGSGYCVLGAPSASPAFPSPGTQVSWTCSGTSGGSPSPTCTALHSLNAVCGINKQNYLATESGWPSSNFCAAGTSPSSVPVFPVPGGSVTWLCGGVYSGATVSCTATRSENAPQCGTNSQVFASSVTSWPGTFCVTGNLTPASPVPLFPTAGGLPISWICANSVGSASCSASRLATPAPSISLTAAPSGVTSGGSTALSWVVTNPSSIVANSCVRSNSQGRVEWQGSGYLAASSATPVTIPNIAANTTFTLTCTKTLAAGGGTVSGSVTVTAYSCTGSVPPLSSICPGDNTGLSGNVARSLVQTCSSPAGSLPKCQYACTSPAVYDTSSHSCIVCGVCDSSANHCTGERWSDNCGNSNACGPGTKDCREFWKEVAP